MGAWQTALGGTPAKFPWYIVGTLLVYGALLGRSVCGWLCPFGLCQELLYKIPGVKLPKSKTTRAASRVKYLVLAVMVVLLPLYYALVQGMTVPAFCKYICPAGTLTAGIPLMVSNAQLRSLMGALFGWKVGLLLAIVMGCIIFYRAFCRFLCPLGAIYGLFNRVALLS
ncbi:MAG: 4Fe-4S binding protein, partial [Symbiobacteriaceae bacterium]|nr:4Fe-4S binding protein [Symbiobacteriaceae bacterium]